MSQYNDEATNTARDYYNSEDADNFYFNVWGGEDIHVGLYKSDDEPIRDASRRTVEQMTDKLTGINKDSKVLDVGAGYGGSMRYLAKRFGCHCVALNLSEVENDRDREMNKEQGLADLIDVVDASFEDVDYPDNSFDFVWSQDAILHSDHREKVLEEVVRVLKPGGEFVMTDPMQADDCPEGVLDPILNRIHLNSLGSPGFYIDTAKKMGMEDLGFEDHTHQLTRHYSRVRQTLIELEDELADKVVSRDYIERMKEGLQHWINGGNSGYLAWGIFHFRKKQ
ncbi:sarcosine/dimethylglycine N-methyltransferase [Methylohalomonas lacus]|uniref:Sarcosine/dimethylglycine N-methyltransferase n=1 Tax=Methylohalomonas lacus TaxID=398773 RepID=A0AAE3HIC1_9GAMM|nr:methyltransferase domain-containing protein [Methylohalomonas lacus]MCS3902886.1 sarcosine/dimethylglycine N-methyltransferase [Methylohalomonas lacus]